MTTTAPYYTHTEEVSYTHDVWFNGFIAQLREHQAQIKDRTISNPLKAFYNTFLVGNTNEIVHQAKQLSQAHFVPTILAKYIDLIQESKQPEQLAFAYTDNEILVWAELEDDDWTTEQSLILAEAQTNAEFHKYGYDITTTFVETSDALPIPNHYQPFLTK